MFQSLSKENIQKEIVNIRRINTNKTVWNEDFSSVIEFFVQVHVFGSSRLRKILLICQRSSLNAKFSPNSTSFEKEKLKVSRDENQISFWFQIFLWTIYLGILEKSNG